MDFNYPLDMNRPQALSRRAEIFMEWLTRKEYSDHAGDISINKVKDVIMLINYCFSDTLEPQEWKHYNIQLKEYADWLTDEYETEDARKANYEHVRHELLIWLDEYRVLIANVEDNA